MNANLASEAVLAPPRKAANRTAPATSAQELGATALALLSERGEASGVALARQILNTYAGFGAAERLAFLEILAERFGPDPVRLDRAIERYRADPGAPTATDLFAAAEPPRQELIRRLNLAPGGTAGVVRMREDVLAALHERPALAAVDNDFVHLLSSWFNRGFLEIRRIDWTTPAHILEKVIRYEAVHEITSWHDLQLRLEPADRRCFAFFHPALADEPLIFVEVALTTSIPQSIAPLLAGDRRPIAPQRARTAVFYSISNCQVGLKGVSFGNFLIKQVAEELKRELPSLRTFITLSPVPGFRAWLQREAGAATFLRASDRRALEALDRPDWATDPAALKRARPVLQAAVAHYFLQAKNGSGKPADPVARFHLGNGARLDRINWMGDGSVKGLRQGAGFMVNYRYDLGQVERNHEAYANRAEVVASQLVRRMERSR
jgi:malonyl-CoA decarboxylase